MNKILYPLLFLLLITAVSAQEIEVTSTAVKNILLQDEQAEFNIAITNNQESDDRITYVVEDLSWGFEKKFFDIPKSAEHEFVLTLTPPKGIQPGFYSINLKTYSLNNAKQSTTIPLIITIVEEKDLIDVTLDSNPEGLSAGKENRIKLLLKNKYNLQVNDIKLNLESEIFSDTETFNFDPGEGISKELIVFVEEDTGGTTYNLNITLTKQGNVIYSETKELLVGIKKDIQESTQEEKGFLENKIIVTTENKGNTESQESYTTRLTAIQKTFTTFDPEPTSKEKRNGNYYYTWKNTLVPEEQSTIIIKTNYRSPLIAILVIILFIFIIHSLTKSHISVLKKVLTIKFGEGLSDMKVQLVIKNRSRFATKKVRVVDYLPKVVKAPTEYGTIKPNKVKKSQKGLILIWDIPELVKNEERVISYRIKSKIHVIGRLVIPRAIVRYKTKKGKTYVASSKRVTLFSR